MMGRILPSILGLSMLRTMVYTVYNMKTMDELMMEGCGAAK
jgi:nicotinate-nucleotide--dimethylbenzimidazole phosphoribosyltransferase